MYNVATLRFLAGSLPCDGCTLVQEQVLSRAPVTLRDGDVISFGDADFWFLRASTLYERVAR